MTHDPNMPPAQRPDQQYGQPPQFGQYPQQGAFGSNQTYPPQHAQHPHFAPPASPPKLKAREDAVNAREVAAKKVESPAVVKTFGQGVWTVGKDIEPGDYKTSKAVVGDCSWKITRTGSNGGDYIDYDLSVSGGRPMVSLVEGQTFGSDGCGDWAKQ